MSYDPYQELANTIVLQAVADYRKARKDLKIYPRDKKAMYRAREIIRFFRSDYFSVITSIDAESLINNLREEFK